MDGNGKVSGIDEDAHFCLHVICLVRAIIFQHSSEQQMRHFHSFPTDQRRPTLNEFINFKTTSGTINIAEQISTNYKSLGIQLLEDATGSITDAMEKECQIEK